MEIYNLENLKHFDINQNPSLVLSKHIGKFPKTIYADAEDFETFKCLSSIEWVDSPVEFDIFELDPI